MQPIAAWLVGRPQNGVFGLVGTLLLPLSPLLSGAVVTLLILEQDLRKSAVQVLAAGAVLAIVALLVKAPLTQILVNAAGTWLPAGLLAFLLRYWRSLTLTLQVSAILAIVSTLAFFLLLGDPAAYWNNEIARLVELFREGGLVEQAELLSARQAVIVPQMTMLFVFFSWSVYVLVLLLGYALYLCLPDKEAQFGRFRDLNFGRVLALILAVTSLLALLSDANWLQNVALVVFAIFWLQGLALLHWLRSVNRLPLFVLVATYAMLPFMNVLLVALLAVVGYIDAWFDFRRRGIVGQS